MKWNHPTLPHRDEVREAVAVRWIPSFEGRYAATEDGRIVSYVTDTPRVMTTVALVREGRSTIYTAEELHAAAWHGAKLDLRKPTPRKSSSRKGNYVTVLTEEKVRGIRAMLRAGGHRQKDIAAAFGCSQSTISNIKAGRLWADAQD